MNTRIFVSYAREDQPLAGSLVSFLRAAGFDVWFDKDSLLAGQDWKMVITQEIARARLLLICLSKNSVDKTGFVQKEMRLALEQAELRPESQVYIVPVSLDGCHAPHSLTKWHVLNLRELGASTNLLKAIGSATGEGSRAPQVEHDSFTNAITSYNDSLNSPGLPTLGLAAQEIHALIEQEPDLDARGIVEILKEIRPGLKHFFPRIQYGGTPKSIKARLFREAMAELVSAQILFPPEINPMTKTATYEYRIP